MDNKIPIIPETPITEETFERQGWTKHSAFDDFDDFGDEELDNIDRELDEDEPYFWTLALPKERNDKYAPVLVSNSNDDLVLLQNMGLKPGQYFVEIFDLDGLGFCTSEEQLEILYYSLTKRHIE